MSRRRTSVLVGLYVCFVVGIAVLFSGLDKHTGRSRGDFTKYSLAASKALFAGDDPYSRESVGKNYKYFPLNAVLLYPFTKMSKYTAQGAWSALGIGLITVAIACHWWWIPGDRRVKWTGLLFALALTLRLVWMNIKLGQWNTYMYSLGFIGLFLIHKGRNIGTILLGLAAGLKFSPFAFVVYLFLRRNYRAAILTLLAAAFWIIVLPTAVLGPKRHIDLLKTYTEQSNVRYDQITEGKTSYSLSARGVLDRLLAAVPSHGDDDKMHYMNVLNLRRSTASRISGAVALCGVFAVLVFTYRRSAALTESSPLQDLLFVGAWYAAIQLLSPGVRMAHLIALFTPMFVVATAAQGIASSRARRGIFVLLNVCIIGLLLCSELTSHWKYDEWVSIYGAPALTSLILMVLCFWLINAARRQQPGDLEVRQNGVPT